MFKTFLRVHINNYCASAEHSAPPTYGVWRGMRDTAISFSILFFKRLTSLYCHLELTPSYWESLPVGKAASTKTSFPLYESTFPSSEGCDLGLTHLRLKGRGPTFKLTDTQSFHRHCLKGSRRPIRLALLSLALWQVHTQQHCTSVDIIFMYSWFQRSVLHFQLLCLWKVCAYVQVRQVAIKKLRSQKSSQLAIIKHLQLKLVMWYVKILG